MIGPRLERVIPRPVHLREIGEDAAAAQEPQIGEIGGHRGEARVPRMVGHRHRHPEIG